MAHKMVVPPEYANGRNQEAFEGTSDIERCIHAFEKTWWAVMNKFAQDIHYKPRHNEFICSGTTAEAQACLLDGYEEAVRKVQGLLETHKAGEVQSFIKKSIAK
jgi:hypothetical protein